MLKRFLVFYLVVASYSLWGQKLTPKAEYEQLHNAFPKSDYIIDEYTWLLEIELDGDDVVSTLTRKERGMYMNKAEGRIRHGYVHYDSFETLEELKAQTLIPEEKGYKSVKVEDFSEYDMSSGGSLFYTDDKTVKFIWPQLQKGAKLDLEVEISTSDAHFLPSFYVPAYAPIINGRFEVSIDNGIDIEFMPFNIEKLNGTYEKAEKGKKTIHTWSIDNYDGFSYSSDESYPNRYVPKILLRTKSFQTKEKQVNVFRDINDLHAWYCELILEIDKNVDEPLKRLVDSILVGHNANYDKMTTLYRWVQDNIKYVAFEDGFNGFKPRPASMVCKERFGDCKGMANLLVTMLGHAGIEANLTWVGTREKTYTYDEVPSPQTDNHMILTVDLDDKRYVLDPTNSRLPVNLPSPFIQGKQSLINKNCTSFELYNIPVTDAQHNQMTDTLTANIAGNDLIGEGKLTMTGYSRIFFLDRLGKTDYNSLLDLSRLYLLKGSNKFTLDTVWLENQDDFYQPLILHYHYQIADYIVESNDEQYLNLHLIHDFGNAKTDDDRLMPIMIEFKSKITLHVDLQVNKGHQVTYIPDDIEVDHEMFAFNAKTIKGTNTITYTSEDIYNYLELESEYFDAWNLYVDQVNLAKRQSIIIKKK